MSRLPQNSRTLATLRKQRQRARLRQAGRSKIEAWITPDTKALLERLSKKTGAPVLWSAQLVLEFATPLFLREVSRRIDAISADLSTIARFERYGVLPHPGPTEPVRIGRGDSALILDPREHFRIRQRIEPVLIQLERYGLSRADVRAIALGIGGKRHKAAGPRS